MQGAKRTAIEHAPGEGNRLAPLRAPAPRRDHAAILALQHTAGNTAVTALLRKTGALKPRDGPKQEQSWANPAKVASPGPQLAGTIYFDTTEFNLDAEDDAVLLEIAKAYAPWAQRSLGKQGAEIGIGGSIVGYADPRASFEPNNAELSARRADVVERRLRRHIMLHTTGLHDGDILFDKKAGGVAGAYPNATPQLDGTEHGFQRRVEIYITGHAIAPPPKPAVPPSPPIVFPKHPDDGWDRWVPQILAGDREVMGDISRLILGTFVAQRAIRSAFFYTGWTPLVWETKNPETPFTYGGIPWNRWVDDAGTFPFKRTKPPWWDQRSAPYARRSIGRQALDPKARETDEMVRRALMLIGDMRWFNYYVAITINRPDSAYMLYMKALRDNLYDDKPVDPVKMREWATTIQEFMFIWDETKWAAMELANIEAGLYEQDRYNHLDYAP